MPDNVAPMVDFNHTIVELVGNEVMVGCRGGDGASQHNRDQRRREDDLDGKFHENPPVRDIGRSVRKSEPGRPSPENHGQQSRKFRPGICLSCQKIVKELSLSCQKLGKLLRTLVPLAVGEVTAYAESRLKGSGSICK